ncbi:conserved hypothetical protein [Trichinella spiralis]|uniref:hypothetical protein n=1 Tax=Trichinella spiralis TaxID=6334 RepID=UPI0001EFECA9|nr:conserved hypothetical protein [Trichinella spiralis]
MSLNYCPVKIILIRLRIGSLCKTRIDIFAPSVANVALRRGDSSSQRRSAHIRRRECRSLFQLRWEENFVPRIRSAWQSPNLTAGPQLISDGRGQTTCSFFFPDNSSFIYSTTSKAGAECPKSVCEGSSPPKQCNNSYIWNIFNGFNILLTDSTGKTHYLTDDSFYNAEGAVSPDGKSIVFTSTRGGDLDLWLMRLNGTEVVNITQLTDITGYDGGAFFSPLGDKIVYRAYHPKTAEEITNYFQLLNLSITKPLHMEIFTMNADGSDQKQLTNFGYASWAPYFYPDGSKIIFSSNHHGNHSVFNLFLIDQDGNNLEQITTNPGLDMFPMFSYDKKKLIFVSNRNGNGFNVFMADWIADSANLHAMSPVLMLITCLISIAIFEF